MADVATDSLIDKILDDMEVYLDYIGIGTGAVPTATSITLNNETQRKAATITRDANTVIAEGYWDETEANGSTYTNTGVFIGGTSTPGTGTLAAGGGINVAKDATQSLTASIEITVEAVNA